ncbi:MAG: hypothetical protein K0U74_03170 [Alphaproteobacteria bacterium]|nr:hypothetical protein [Alphaproteobacteria bacterium]
MTTRENTLKKSLMGMKEQPKPQLVAVEPAAQAASTNVAPSRKGKKVISGYFDPAASRQLRMLAIEQDTTVQALLEEALNDLFKKHGRSSVAC